MADGLDRGGLDYPINVSGNMGTELARLRLELSAFKKELASLRGDLKKPLDLGGTRGGFGGVAPSVAIQGLQRETEQVVKQTRKKLKETQAAVGGISAGPPPAILAAQKARNDAQQSQLKAETDLARHLERVAKNRSKTEAAREATRERQQAQADIVNARALQRAQQRLARAFQNRLDEQLRIGAAFGRLRRAPPTFAPFDMSSLPELPRKGFAGSGLSDVHIRPFLSPGGLDIKNFLNPFHGKVSVQARAGLVSPLLENVGKDVSQGIVAMLAQLKVAQAAVAGSKLVQALTGSKTVGFIQGQGFLQTSGRTPVATSLARPLFDQRIAELDAARREAPLVGQLFEGIQHNVVDKLRLLRTILQAENRPGRRFRTLESVTGTFVGGPTIDRQSAPVSAQLDALNRLRRREARVAEVERVSEIGRSRRTTLDIGARLATPIGDRRLFGGLPGGPLGPPPPPLPPDLPGGPGDFQGFIASLREGHEASGLFRRSLESLFRIFVLFAGVRAATNAIRGLVSTMVEFNRESERSKLGLATVASAVGQVRDASGQLLKGAQAIEAAESVATGQLANLRIEGLKTRATFEQLAQTFQTALGPGLQAGLSFDQVRKFTVQISQAAAAINLPQAQLAEEIRSILSGTVSIRTTRIANVLQITNEDIRRATEAGDLYGLLQTKFEAFSAAGEKSLQTFDGLVANIQAGFRIAAGEAEGSIKLYERLKSLLASTRNLLLEQNQGGTLAPDTRVQESFSAIADALRSGVSLADDFVKALDLDSVRDAALVVGRVLEGVVVTVGQFVTGLTSGLLDGLNVVEGVGDALGKVGIRFGFLQDISEAVSGVLGRILGLVASLLSVVGPVALQFAAWGLGLKAVSFLFTLIASNVLFVVDSVSRVALEIRSIIPALRTWWLLQVAIAGSARAAAGSLALTALRFGVIGVAVGAAIALVSALFGLFDKTEEKASAGPVSGFLAVLERLKPTVTGLPQSLKGVSDGLKEIADSARKAKDELEKTRTLFGLQGLTRSEAEARFDAEIKIRERVRDLERDLKDAQEQKAALQGKQNLLLQEQAALTSEQLAKEARALELSKLILAEEARIAREGPSERPLTDFSVPERRKKLEEAKRLALLDIGSGGLVFEAEKTRPLIETLREELSKLGDDPAGEKRLQTQLELSGLLMGAEETILALDDARTKASGQLLDILKDQLSTLQSQEAERRKLASFEQISNLRAGARKAGEDLELQRRLQGLGPEPLSPDIRTSGRDVLGSLLGIGNEQAKAARERALAEEKIRLSFQQQVETQEELRKLRLDGDASAENQLAVVSEVAQKYGLQVQALNEADAALEKLVGRQATLAEAFLSFGDELKRTLSEAFQGLIDGISQALADSILDALDPSKSGSFRERLASVFRSIAKQILASTISAIINIGIRALGSAAGGGGFAEGGEVPNSPAPGHLRPKGLAVSDTVPAWLTPGEYVLPVESARKYAGILEGLRQGIVDPISLRSAASRNTRRAVASRVGRVGYAEGGSVAGRSSVSGTRGTTPVLVADEGTVDRLLKGGSTAVFRFLRNNKAETRAALGLKD